MGESDQYTVMYHRVTRTTIDTENTQLITSQEGSDALAFFSSVSNVFSGAWRVAGGGGTECSGGWDEEDVGSVTLISRKMSPMAGYIPEHRCNTLQNALKTSAGAGAIGAPFC